MNLQEQRDVSCCEIEEQLKAVSIGDKGSIGEWGFKKVEEDLYDLYNPWSKRKKMHTFSASSLASLVSTQIIYYGGKK